MKSLFFEELAVGMEFASCRSRPFTPDLIESYFRLTGDRFNIHRDDTFAERCGLLGPMVPGNLVVAVTTGLLYDVGHFADSLLVQAAKTTRFLRPIYINQTIRATERVVCIEDRPGKSYGRVVLERHVVDDQDRLAVSIDQDYRVLRRGAYDQLCVGPLRRTEALSA